LVCKWAGMVFGSGLLWQKQPYLILIFHFLLDFWKKIIILQLISCLLWHFSIWDCEFTCKMFFSII
jgi:hypothetical protein